MYGGKKGGKGAKKGDRMTQEEEAPQPSQMPPGNVGSGGGPSPANPPGSVTRISVPPGKSRPPMDMQQRPPMQQPQSHMGMKGGKKGQMGLLPLPPPPPLGPQGQLALPTPPGSMPGVPGMQLAVPLAQQKGQSQALALHQQGGARALIHAPKKPFVFRRPKQYILCFGELPGEVPMIKLQEIMEQCGPLIGFRRPEGKHFAFCQYGTIDAAWRATVCFAGKTLPTCVNPLLIIPDNATAKDMAEWKQQQTEKLKHINADFTEAELEWELEKTTIMVQAAVDEKIKELVGWITTGHRPNEALLETEKKRVEKEEARRSRRVAEMQAEVFPLQRQEKKRRLEEMKLDDEDRALEEKENLMPEHERRVFRKTESSKGIKDAKSWRRLLRCVATEMTQEQVFNTQLYKDIDQEAFRESGVMEVKLRTWLTKRLGNWMGGRQPELVEFTLRRIKAKTHPTSLIGDLSKVLEEKDAEVLVDRLWRMLIFELKRQGLLALKD